MELREIQTTDYRLAEQMLEIQRNAYAVEAELIGFDEIPARYENGRSHSKSAGYELWLI
ncbi:hypothetical protein [Exiguobacterium mexicanum]|uniref:hypothetical protein n=1 Tax=Exiguobacterium mexicanum TaxID=340146 RepID=UPI0037BF4692